MANMSKARGTSFETAVTRWLRLVLDEPTIERRALHGAHDMGDLYGIYAHGLAGIAECKNYKRYGRADVEEWRRQTLAERDNADADFAVLVIHKPGCGGDAKSPTMGRNRVDLTIGDLCNVSVGMRCLMAEPDDHWVTIDLDELARLIRAD